MDVRRLFLVGLSLAPAVVLADVGPVKIFASGLMNPRGIAFAPNGALYVAEGGMGGPGPCIQSPSQPPGTLRCYGETGALTQILPEGGFKRILTGLPSLALANGTAEGAPVDVAFLGTAATVTMGWAGDPAVRDSALPPKARMLGSLLQVTPSGQYKVLADISAHEAQYNPYPNSAVDSNPYNTLVQPGRRITADAGANTLIETLANGERRTFAVLDPVSFGRQPVPTSIAEGPDGKLYVGQLTGFPFWRGSASVLRMDSDGSNVETAVSGLTAVVDVTFDAGGAMYILEIASGQVAPPPPLAPGLGTSRLLRKCPGADPVELLGGLFFAAGVAIGPDGAAYITNRSTSPTAGEVLQLPLTPCP